jgi:steroid delta-isomerase-like uncharacterized protein
MSKQDNINNLQQFGEAVSSGKLEALNELVSANSVDHDPAPGQVAGPKGYIEFFGKLRTAFPDLGISLEYLVADEENVSFAYTITGTHQGDFNGIPATHKRIKARGMQISRFENGKMVERWGSSDELGILKQLGVL